MNLMFAQIQMFAPNDQTFQHIDPETGEHRFFLASAMWRFVNKYPDVVPKHWANIHRDLYDHVLKNCGIESKKLEALTMAQIDEPVIIANIKDSHGVMQQLIVDGHHRIVKRPMIGKTTFEFYLFEEILWRQFLAPHDALVDKSVLSMTTDDLRRMSDVSQGAYDKLGPAIRRK